MTKLKENKHLKMAVSIICSIVISYLFMIIVSRSSGIGEYIGLRFIKPSHDFALSWTLTRTGLSFVIGIALAYFFFRSKDEPFTEQIKLRTHTRLFVFLTVMITAVFISDVIQSVVMSLITPSAKPHGTTTTQLLLTSGGVMKPFTDFIYPVIIAPILEELFFRGVLGRVFDVFKRKSIVNMVVFVVISSLFFGLLHYDPTIDSTTAIALVCLHTTTGAIFGIVYLVFKDLKLNIATHSFGNFIVWLINTLISIT